MPDNKIKELLKKYLEGRATSEEEKIVDDWYDSLSPDQPRLPLSDSRRRNLRSLYWNSIKTKISRPAGRSRRLWPGFIGLAASIAAIVVTVLFFSPSESFDKGLSRSEMSPDREVIVNDTDGITQVSLPDSSQVTLFPGSRLQYYRGFNASERKVELSGKALFNISHNPQKPFYVFANEVVTKVLGTSFSVSAYPEDISITVAVKSGKVSVYANSGKDAALSQAEDIVLSPNQQAVYSRGDKKVSRTLVKDPQVVMPDEEVKKIRFEGVPVSEIFRALEKMYNVEIDFEEDVFSKCSMTTSVKGKELYDRIEVICEITAASYKVENTTIVIRGAGCN